MTARHAARIVLAVALVLYAAFCVGFAVWLAVSA